MVKDCVCCLGLIVQFQCQISFDQLYQCFGCVGGGLVIFDYDVEVVDGCGVMFVFEVIVFDFYFFCGQMVEGQIEFQD